MTHRNLLLTLTIGLVSIPCPSALAESNGAIDYNNQGVKALEAKDFPKAQELFSKSVAADPGFKVARNNLAISYNNLGLQKYSSEDDILGAMNSFYKSYLADPYNPTTKQNIASCTASITKKLAHKPDVPVSELLGDYWLCTGRYCNALAEYEMAEESNNKVREKIVLVFDYAKDEDPALVAAHEKASGKISDIVRLGKERNKDSHEKELSDFWSKLNRLTVQAKYDQVVDELSKYLHSNPTDSRALQQRGRAYYHMNRLSEAEADAKKALELDQKSVDALALLGQIDSLRGNHDAACKVAAEAIAINPDIPFFYALRANELRSLKKLDEAKNDDAKLKELSAAGVKRYIADGEPKVRPNSDIYMGMVSTLLSKRWKRINMNELCAGAPGVLVSKVAFDVSFDGKISNVHLFKTSGVGKFDEAAVTLMKGCSKTLPLPTGMPPVVTVVEAFASDANSDKPKVN